jgi:hypothetical protein
MMPHLKNQLLARLGADQLAQLEADYPPTSVVR